MWSWICVSLCTIYYANADESGHMIVDGDGVDNTKHGDLKYAECALDTATEGSVSNKYGSEIGVQCCSADGTKGYRKELGCVSGVPFAKAEQICVDAGYRLCTQQETLSKVADGRGCSFDAYHTWTSTPCDDSDDSEVHSSFEYEVQEAACLSGAFISSAAECEAAASSLGIAWNSCCQNNDNLPYGCLKRSDNDIIWNGNADTDNIFPCSTAGNCDHGMRWAVCYKYDYVVTEDACSVGGFIASAAECEAAAIALDIEWNSCCQNNDNLPYGCLKRSDNDVIWNGNAGTDNVFPCSVSGNCDHGMRWAVCYDTDDSVSAAQEKCCVDGWSQGTDCQNGCYNCACSDGSSQCGCVHLDNIDERDLYFSSDSSSSSARTPFRMVGDNGEQLYFGEENYAARTPFRMVGDNGEQLYFGEENYAARTVGVQGIADGSMQYEASAPESTVFVLDFSSGWASALVVLLDVLLVLNLCRMADWPCRFAQRK